MSYERWAQQAADRITDDWRRNLTPEQYEKFCHIHDKVEEGPGYQRCFECGHLYITSDELLKIYNEEGLNSHNALKDPYMIEHQLDIGQYRAAELKDIFFCPLCLHDF